MAYDYICGNKWLLQVIKYQTEARYLKSYLEQRTIRYLYKRV